MKNIAKIIKEEWNKHNLTQVEFAIRSGLGLRFVREWAKSTARIDKVMQALYFFGYSLIAVKTEEIKKWEKLIFIMMIYFVAY